MSETEPESDTDGETEPESESGSKRGSGSERPTDSETESSSRGPGAPLGNTNAVGNNGGPPLGNQNAVGNSGGGPVGNQYAVGNDGGAPKNNGNAQKHGLRATRTKFYARLDEDRQEIIDEMERALVERFIQNNGHEPDAADVQDLFEIAIGYTLRDYAREWLVEKMAESGNPMLEHVNMTKEDGTHVEFDKPNAILESIEDIRREDRMQRKSKNLETEKRDGAGGLQTIPAIVHESSGADTDTESSDTDPELSEPPESSDADTDSDGDTGRDGDSSTESSGGETDGETDADGSESDTGAQSGAEADSGPGASDETPPSDGDASVGAEGDED